MARAIGIWPEATVPGLEGAAVVPADTPERFAIDPDPTTRGEHPGVVLEHTPGVCRWSAERRARLPPPPPDPAITPESTLGAAAADATRAGLVLFAPDLALERERSRWHTLLEALDTRARALYAPTRALALDAVMASCRAIAPGGVLLVATIGPGRSGDGGGLVLADDEVLAYRDLLALVDLHCTHLAAIAWVIDASHATFDPPTRGDDEPALVVVRASDELAPDAARVERHGPGLLGAVLEARIGAGREALCASGSRLDNGELVALLAVGGGGDEDLRAALERARWEAFGAPAVERVIAEGGEEALTPPIVEQIRGAVLAAIPEQPLLVRGRLPDGERCASDDECTRCAPGACQRPVCENGRCGLAPDDGALCDDDDPCTADDRCRSEGCRGEPRVCDDANPCTADTCEPGRGCVAEPVVDGTCDDGDPCTEDDRCDARGACAGQALVCDDGDPCTLDRCVRPEPGDVDPGTAGCVFEATSGPCDDGDPCTLADQCRNRVCAGTARTCGDDNACTLDRCDPATGECRFDPVADLAGCDDGDPCTTLDRCRDGLCVGLARTCDDALACTFDRCEDGRCTHLPAPGLCLSPGGTTCVAVGERPPDAPCLVCAATDRLEPVADDSDVPCADDGLACTIDRCRGGVCAHDDTPETCHDGQGRCVTRGELVTGCLLCQGGGVVTPVASDAPCMDAPGCALGRCDGLGRCVCAP